MNWWGRLQGLNVFKLITPIFLAFSVGQLAGQRINSFSVAVIKYHDPKILQSKALLLASSSRGVSVQGGAAPGAGSWEITSSTANPEQREQPTSVARLWILKVFLQWHIPSSKTPRPPDSITCPKQCLQLGTRHSDTQTYAGHSSFKPPQAEFSPFTFKKKNSNVALERWLTE